jgi:hypothetical protein
VKRPQKKQKKPRQSTINKKPAWQVVLFISVVMLGLGIFFGFMLPWLNQQDSAKLSMPKPEGGIIKPSLTSAIQIKTPLAEPSLESLSSSAPLPVAVTNKTFAAFFSHSWDIPEPTEDFSDIWVEVDLSSQKLIAYKGSTILRSFAVSTGTRGFPTVPGSFKIYAKYNYYTMRGPGYNLPDVPYSMFFYKGYSIHGTYWHHNFGTPMSHGCVNMETSAAAWLYAQTSIGTPVFVHY